MEAADTRKRRTAEFLLVLLLHGLLIDTLIRRSKPAHLSKSDSFEPLLMYFLPRPAPEISNVVKTPIPSSKSGKSDVPNINTASDSAAAVPIAPSIEPAPKTPDIDWQNELEIAAQNRISEAEKERAYRDLSKSLSPAQLNWLNEHRMEPATSPGITWRAPRVEITQEGLPIVHINDRCVLVPVSLLPMVFCSFGHVEPNGDLFKHMRDLPRPSASRPSP